MSWVFIGVIVLLVIFIIVGAVKGFSETLLSLASIALSLVIAWFVTPGIHTMIQEKTTWETGAATKFEETILKNVETEEEMDHFGDRLPLPMEIKESIANASKNETGLANKKAAVSLLISGWIITVIIQVILSVALIIILSLIGKLLSKLIKKTDLAKIDRFFGAILGLAEGILVVDAILLLIPLFSGTPVGLWLNDQIAASKPMTWIYDHNVLSTLAFALFHIKL